MQTRSWTCFNIFTIKVNSNQTEFLKLTQGQLCIPNAYKSGKVQLKSIKKPGRFRVSKIENTWVGQLLWKNCD